MERLDELVRAGSRHAVVSLAIGLLFSILDQVGAEAQVRHLDQEDLVELVEQGRVAEAFELAFDHGDRMFETAFTTEDGVGANVGNGAIFTRVPRISTDRENGRPTRRRA